jgi:hypothetical protein
VVRPGGLVIAATISRFTSLLDGFVRGYQSDPEFMSMVRHTLGSGEHLNAAAERNWFTTAYFHHPAELPREVAAAGLALDRIASVEGPMWILPNLDELLADEGSTALLLQQIRALENEPNLWGSSCHLLTIAHRPGAPAPPGAAEAAPGRPAAMTASRPSVAAAVTPLRPVGGGFRAISQR